MLWVSADWNVAGMQVDPSKPLFGFIGRLEEQKGVDILLAALPQIAEKGDVQVTPAPANPSVLRHTMCLAGSSPVWCRFFLRTL